ncbi:MAG: LemA family protein [Bacilli bacterium]
MRKGFLTIIVVVVMLVIVIGSVSISSYNSLVNVDENVDLSSSQVVSRLNQRQALIEQLVPTVVGLQEHAETIYDMITSARESYSIASAASDLEGMIDADAAQALAINQLLVVMESNPSEIYAGAGFIDLMQNISGMESSIAYYRGLYNEAVAEYNRSVRQFPKIIFASMFSFEKEKPYWKMNEGADEIPQIDFTN